MEITMADLWGGSLAGRTGGLREESIVEIAFLGSLFFENFKNVTF
jgi:hypothetical protein